MNRSADFSRTRNDRRIIDIAFLQPVPLNANISLINPVAVKAPSLNCKSAVVNTPLRALIKPQPLQVMPVYWQ